MPSEPDLAIPRVVVMGLALQNLDGAAIADHVLDAALARRKMLVVNANAHLAVLSQTQTWLRTMFASADIAFCDGAGVQLACRLLTGRAIARATPPEWVASVMQRLGDRGSVFWLGGEAGVVAKAARAYEDRFGVRTVGTHHGFFDATAGSPETLALVERINRAAPSILLVTMSMPRQERWLWDNWDRLEPGVAITAGALVDHAAGRVRRPPGWIADSGFEWLVRLVREPRRLWRRYLLGLPVFGFYLARYAIVARHR